jgi:hypothetical protein
MQEAPSPVQRKVEPSRPTTSNVMVHPRASADKDNSFGTGHLPNRSSSRSKGPVPAPKSSPSRRVITRPLAREPRIEHESMRDFADFIRYTGPSPGQEKSVKPFVNISGNGPRSANGSSTSLGRKMSTKQNPVRNTDSPSVKTRVNMEPRSPAGLSDGNNDLIDFIRQGPPSTTQQPRIPRNVAPFRTTVDSDQFGDMMGDHGNIESAYNSSTVSTLESKPSTQTINSRTGLLPEPKVVQPAYSNTPQKLSGSMANPGEPVITRTRHRVKDPYAIDVSDEEEDEDEDQLTALPHSAAHAPPAPAPRQESLMDFLNDMPPPSTSSPQPFLLSANTLAAAKARAANSSSSSSTTSRANSQFGAISVASKGKARLQARSPAVDDRRGGSATSDLADFLRNSGPPEREVEGPEVPRNEGEKRRLRFWRRERRTYGDLP